MQRAHEEPAPPSTSTAKNATEHINQPHTAPLQVTFLSPFLQRSRINLTLIILATSKQSITVVSAISDLKHQSKVTKR